MPVEIRETIVEPAGDSAVVTLLVSDAPKAEPEIARFRLQLSVHVHATPDALLTGVQMNALKLAFGELKRLHDEAFRSVSPQFQSQLDR
jgi:hypothetical protein